MLDIQFTCVYISCWYLLMQQCCDCLDWWLKPLPRETTSLKHVSKESWARCLLTCKEAWVWSFFVKYPSVIKHSKGKNTIYRCVFPLSNIAMENPPLIHWHPFLDDFPSELNLHLVQGFSSHVWHRGPPNHLPSGTTWRRRRKPWDETCPRWGLGPDLMLTTSWCPLDDS